MWSLSPAATNSDGDSRMLLVNASGSLFTYDADDSSGAIAPVINLSPEYASTMVGTGTITDPYIA